MLEIVYFHWAENNGPSIVRSFRPLIDSLKEEYSVKEYRVPKAGANPINLFRNIWFVWNHRTKTGINHVTGDIHYAILGLIGTKSVLTIHDDYVWRTAHNWFDCFYKWVFWIALPILLSKRVLCITEETRKNIYKRFPSKKLEVLPQHIIDSGFKFHPKYEINKSCVRLLQIGTNRQKNLETTICAIKGMNCHLRVVMQMKESQIFLAKELGVDFSNVYNISDEQIVKEYEDADIILFPSLYEGFGMPPLEAQTMGRACITSDREPMRWVTGGKAVLLENPLDIEGYREKLQRLIDDDNLRRSVIDEGYINSLRFSREQVKRNFVKFYDAI